jgi:long-subunit acyl-CoA synthetase (AMP-forming)
MNYKMIKDHELEAAMGVINRINSSGDPRVPYGDVRPITDVKHMIESSVSLYEDRVAFFVKDYPGKPYRAISYGRMKADLDALGTALLDQGLKGEKIAIIGENCYQWALSYLAAVCGVGVAVPLDKELSQMELEALLIESEAECAIFTKKYRKLFLDIKKNGNTRLKLLIDMNGEMAGNETVMFEDCLKRGRMLVNKGNRDFLDAEIIQGDMCALLFTSGTTGIAKGVMLSHKNLISGMMIPPTAVKITKDEVFFSVLPIHHCYECTCGFLIPLYRGAAVAFCEGLKSIVKNLSEARPTVLLAVPLIVENLYRKIWQNARKSGKAGLLGTCIKINRFTKRIGIDLSRVFFKQIHELFGGRMRLIICGGAAISPEILQGIRDFGITALQGYGLTECSPICALNPDMAIKNDSAGYLLPGLQGMIENPDPETGIGEICARGDHIMLGYYNNPEATAEVIKEGWFHTGDLGYIDGEKYVYITGRRKNVIITKNGKNVFPEELEYRLGQLEEVEASMVWGMPSETTGETVIVATILLNRETMFQKLGANFTDKEAEDYIWKKVDEVNESLALFKRIRRIILRHKDFDMTTAKKIKRFVEENKNQ